jgi:uncharacterized protein
MSFKIKDIPPEGLTLEFAESLDVFEEGIAGTPVKATLHITPGSGGLIHITGGITSAPLVQCSRCLKKFPYPVETAIDFDLCPVRTLNADRDHEHELDKSELDMEFYQGDEIEPVDIVREHLLLALPMVPLHDEQCKGLCTTCGADLNVAACNCEKSGGEQTSAFSALKDMFKK